MPHPVYFLAITPYDYHLHFVRELKEGCSYFVLFLEIKSYFKVRLKELPYRWKKFIIIFGEYIS